MGIAKSGDLDTKQGEGGELETREREEKIRTQTTPRLEPTAQRPQPTTRLFGTEATHGARAILNIKYDPEYADSHLNDVFFRHCAISLFVAHL